MKSIYALCAALLLGCVGFAAPVAQNPVPGSHQTGQFPPLGPSCAAGFAYSVKEQFGNPATGHLWYICRADVACPGVMTASKQGPFQTPRFVYSCAVPPPAVPPACAPGFGKGSISAAANIPGCLTPTIVCPKNFAMMVNSATVAADKHSARFEYQCYRPGV